MILTATKRVDLTAPELLDDPYPVYARLRGDPAIIHLSARPPNTRYAVLRLLDQTPRWRPTFTVRALEALHVAP